MGEKTINSTDTKEGPVSISKETKSYDWIDAAADYVSVGIYSDIRDADNKYVVRTSDGEEKKFSKREDAEDYYRENGGRD